MAQAQKILRDTKARVCSEGGRGRVHSTHTSPGLLSSSPTRIPVWHRLMADSELQQMFPTLSLPGSCLSGWPDLCGYQGLLA